MINSKFSRILIVTLYFVILASHFALSAYNDGREYEGRDNCHELAGADGYFKEYYSFTFSMENVNKVQRIESLAIWGIMLFPWIVWALRKRGFRMTWWRWLLLLSTVSAVSLILYQEIWKSTHYGWYDINILEGNDGPAWWVIFKNAGIYGIMVCFLFSISWVLYVFIKGLMYLYRSIAAKTKE